MQAKPKQILIASKNKGKLREFASLFDAFDIRTTSLLDLPQAEDVEENGSSFAENALIKAKTISERTGLPVLADDSGLCVHALNDAPGIYSARYGGEHGNDARNNEHLLAELMRTTAGQMQKAEDGTVYFSEARFVCALVYYEPNTAPIHVEGTCHGLILPAPRGAAGFGYDPLFYLPSLKKTMAELTTEEKNRISHRSQALNELRNVFSQFERP
jgi:XTP/dITP diphosphohydrolase